MNYEKEKALLFVMPSQPGIQVPLPGTTRDQHKRFFARAETLKAAKNRIYRGKESCQSVVDSLHEQGAAVNTKGGAFYLTTPSGVEIRFNNPIEKAYIKTVYNIGDMARNY